VINLVPDFTGKNVVTLDFRIQRGELDPQ
jgi:hypothetical protein